MMRKYKKPTPTKATLNQLTNTSTPGNNIFLLRQSVRKEYERQEAGCTTFWISFVISSFAACSVAHLKTYEMLAVFI